MIECKQPVTEWLQAAAVGDAAAEGQVVEWAYAELERLAALRLRRSFGRVDVTLEPAALTNEAFLKLLGSPVAFENRRHFLGYAGRVMLRVLIDYQRARSAGKRGGDRVRVTLSGMQAGEGAVPVDVLALDQAMTRLEALYPRQAEIARLRSLWGLTMEEIATVVDVSEPTVRRDWRFARAWLIDALA